MKKRAKHANAAGYGENLFWNTSQRACTSVCMAKRFSVILQEESGILSNWEGERERSALTIGASGWSRAVEAWLEQSSEEGLYSSKNSAGQRELKTHSRFKEKGDSLKVGNVFNVKYNYAVIIVCFKLNTSWLFIEYRSVCTVYCRL